MKRWHAGSTPMRTGTARAGRTGLRRDDVEALWYEPARVLADRLRRRELTATEVLNAWIERIEEHNPSLNAVVSVDFERACDAAAAADRALALGDATGPLHGVPMVLKDGHDVAGLRTTVGSELFDRIAEGDGTVAARLRAAGPRRLPDRQPDFWSYQQPLGSGPHTRRLQRRCRGRTGGGVDAD